MRLQTLFRWLSNICLFNPHSNARKHYYYPPFLFKETRTERLRNMTTVTELVVGKMRLVARQPGCRNWAVNHQTLLMPVLSSNECREWIPNRSQWSAWSLPHGPH